MNNLCLYDVKASRDKMKCTLLFFIFFPTLLYYFLSYFNYQNTISEIKNESLIFAPDLGWISRKHANPIGPAAFLNKYDAPLLRKNDTIAYAQLLGNFPLIPENYRLRIEKKYILLKNVSAFEKEQLLFFIFKDVSELFEETQGKIPFYFVDLGYSSSFASGDLTGNLIAYYCAFHKISRANVLMQYPSVSKNDAIKIFKNDGFKRKKEWVNSSSTDAITAFYNQYTNDFDCTNILKPLEINQGFILSNSFKEIVPSK